MASAPILHADHVGSLLRSKELLKKRSEYENGGCTIEDLQVAENSAIAAVVKLQLDLGMRTITDGELRRAFFFEGMFEGLEGMEFVHNVPLEHFKVYVPYVRFYQMAGLREVPSIRCTGKIRRKKGIHVEDFDYLKSLVGPEDTGRLKVTMLSPIWMHLRHGSEYTYDLSVYKDDDEYFHDLIEAYREEVKELYEHGCRNIQIDDPSFCFFCADSMIEGMKNAGVDEEGLLDRYIEVYNSISKGRPNDLTIGVHMCRGNYMGMHYSEGGYERIARKLFQDLDVDRYYLEYDNERAGNFEPLRWLRAGKTVVLGLVTTKTGTLEMETEVRQRLEEAVDVIATSAGHGVPRRCREDVLRQVCVSPQCGFASTKEGNPITEEEQQRKLELVSSVAKTVWL